MTHESQNRQRYDSKYSSYLEQLLVQGKDLTFNLQPFLNTIMHTNHNLQTKEACGVASIVQVQNAHLVVAYYVKNSHPEPGKNYRMSWSDVDKVIDQGKWFTNEVSGFIHTHRQGSPDHPSYADIKAADPNYINIVYHAGSGRITVYDRSGVRAVYKYEFTSQVNGVPATRRIS